MSLRASLAALGVVATLVLAACDTTPPEPGGEDATPGVSAPTGGATETPSDAAGGGIEPAFIECGVEELEQGTPDLDTGARECIQDAYDAGEEAVFITTRPTIEGDPIMTRVEVIGADEIIVAVDASEDRFAAPEDRVERAYDCTTLATSADGLLEITGCEDGLTFLV